VEITDGEVITNDALYLSLMTNTISPTFVQGGIKSNVHPPSAEVNLNCGLGPARMNSNTVLVHTHPIPLQWTASATF